MGTELDLSRELKRRVGEAAAAKISAGSVVGLGTGSTAAFAIESLGRRLKSGELSGVFGVATSYQSHLLARQHGIPLRELDEVEIIHYALDGADEVDPHGNLIKGRGGAHTREKVVDSLAEQFLVIVDENKRVDRLGSSSPVPLEVLPFAAPAVERAVRRLGGQPKLRMAAKKDGPVITDHGNWLIDVWFEPIPDALALDLELNRIPGLVEHGLFVGLATLLLVARVVDGEIVIEEIPLTRDERTPFSNRGSS